MKRFLSAAFVALCAVVLCAGLAACGGGSGSKSSASASGSASASASSASASSSSAPSTPDNLVDPATINPGWLDSDVRTSDVWYLNGDTSASGIFFTNAANEAGLSYTKVDANDQEGDSEFNLAITDDLHLRTAGNTAPKIDIVFDDDFNCYDYVSGNFYCRGDQVALTRMLANKTYVAEDGSGAEIAFKDDGTFTLTWKDKSQSGTWKVVAATVVETTFDSDGLVEEYRMTVENSAVPRIMDSGWQYYSLKK